MYIYEKEIGTSLARNKTENMWLIQTIKIMIRIISAQTEIWVAMKIDSMSLNYDVNRWLSYEDWFKSS